MVDAGLIIFYILMVLAVGLAIVMPLINALKSPQTFVKSLYGIGAMVVLFAVAYIAASPEITIQQRALGMTESGSKLVGAGLITFYIVLAGAIIGLVYSEINKVLK